MSEAIPASDRVKATKPRLPILDGLRGVAALIVVAFHIFDSDAVNAINHGYLAVDFFFILSGYVMGYAYDDRWATMSIGAFFKRRLIRLHPMVVIGALTGAALFYFSASEFYPGVSAVPVGKLLLATLFCALLIPVKPAMDVRGFNEMYPLNGPMWSLFFEYIANIAYALGLRKLKLRTLGVLALICAGLLVYVIVTSEAGTVSFGWKFAEDHLWKGLVRVMFPFTAGLFLFRLGKTIRLKHAMILASLALLIALPLPRIGALATPWVNGIYESLIIIIVLPLIVLIGAGSQPETSWGEKACDFLGELSYPLYLVHYPIMCIFFGWLSDHKPSLQEKLLMGAGAYVVSLALGYIVMRYVDAPVRRWLGRR